MEGPSFVVSALVNQESFANTMIDTGSQVYCLCDPRFASEKSLERLRILPKEIEGVTGTLVHTVKEVVKFQLDLEGHQEGVFAYVMPLGGYDLILGLPWVTRRDVRIDGRRRRMRVGPDKVIVRAAHVRLDVETPTEMSAAQSKKFVGDSVGSRGVQVFAASLADITKALAQKPHQDPKEELPRQYHQFLKLFDREEADVLPPLRGGNVDHKIELLTKPGGEPEEIPWGPLYSMSRDELLVLRKTLTEHLEKGFIRVSNSPAAAPVLFVRKPGGGLRFCVDYRALNRITKKDRYPLPLIHETLRNIGQAKWFTKLDVIAAFNKIRIAKGDEWKTAFRTRYGLYEWMVTPFGLANAPSTFQKYVNWALRDYLDEFCSAYVDDILVYTNGTLGEHQDHVRKVFGRLQSAGLQLDIGKCEFEVKSTKYLGFIVEAEKGI